MFSKCAKPDCLQKFDYCQGRFFRIHQTHRTDDVPATSHSVQHFWLCETCSHDYTLEYKKGLGVVLMFPYRDSPAFPAERLITVP